jgi:hypothetical protein
MSVSWTGPLFARLLFLGAALLVIGGGVWLVSGNLGQQGAAQAPPPALAPPTREPPAATEPEPSKVVKEVKPPPADKGKLPQEAGATNIIEVDLSKLPPDLVKEVQGAIVGKGKKAPGGKRPPEK